MSPNLPGVIISNIHKMSSVYYSTEGIVIKKALYNEHDFLVRILTRDFGKIEVLARGARKPLSKLNQHIDFLDLAEISFVKNGGLPILYDAFAKNKCVFDFNSFSVAGRVARTLDFITPYEAVDKVFYSLIKNYFTGGDFAENKSVEFLKSVFSHEGYGSSLEKSFLPDDVKESIMSIWPALRS